MALSNVIVKEEIYCYSDVVESPDIEASQAKRQKRDTPELVLPLRYYPTLQLPQPLNASFSPLTGALVKAEPLPQQNIGHNGNDHHVQLVVPPQALARGCKQFWKAGDYDGPTHQNSLSSSAVGMDHVRVHPKFLHSNATSHKWALGAFAELLDNSLDEVNNGGTYVLVDMIKNKKDGTKMLVVEDNGGGMTPDKMRQCMSLGYSAKSKLANTIGQYGNGFKTSTMRLGADAIVFSRCPGNNETRPTQSIGMLSYTFLRGTGKEDIVVPMIDYETRSGGWNKLLRASEDDWNRNLATIVQRSPYLSEEDLLKQFNSMLEHGTRIIIYNLWEDDEGQLELDFDTDPHDIQIRGVDRDQNKINMAKKYPNSKHFFTYQHSLRSYASILYLRLPSQFKIFLRGKEVKHHNLVEDMMLRKEMTYRPQIQEGVPRGSNAQIVATVTIGFVKDAHSHIDVQGFNVYHKNRLIKPFWRVWNAAGSDGRGVIGVLEANFVEPAHDKQGFERTTVLSRLESRLLWMQKNYWTSNCQEVGYVARRRIVDSPNTKSVAFHKEKPLQTGQNGRHSTRMGPNTKSNKKFGQQPSPLNTRTIDDSSQNVSHSCMKPQQGTASEERSHELHKSSQVAPSIGVTRRQPFVDCSEKNPIKGKEENCDSRERLSENVEPTTLNLLSDLNCEKERCKFLENKVEDLEREQMELIDMLAEEKMQRQEEEEKLKKHLMEANKTIDDLRKKVKELESYKPKN